MNQDKDFKLIGSFLLFIVLKLLLKTRNIQLLISRHLNLNFDTLN